MTDELQNETEPTPEQVTEAPATPELNDELVAQYLGVDPEFFSKEVKPQTKGLDKLYAKLNRERAEQGRQKVVEAPAAVADDDDDIELDARSKKVLEKFIREQIAPLQQMQQAVLTTEFENVVDEFSASHKDVPADKVDEVMEELGLWVANTPKQLQKNLERAYKLAKADLFDPDTEVEQRLAERLKATKDDGDIIEVKAKRTPQAEAMSESDIIGDDDIPWYKRMEMFSKE